MSEQKKRGHKKNGGKKSRSRWWKYPRPNKGPVARWVPSWRLVLAILFLLILIAAVALATLIATIRVPEPEAFATAEKSTVYYSDNTPIGSLAERDRTSVPLDSLPEVVPHAVVASEDSSFYTNAGIDLGGIARAAVNNLRGGARQGGSTLTQQYVENYYLGKTTGYAGKFKEALLALKIDQTQSKEHILENYLNTIYFGRGAYGIEAASQAYFGIPSSELDYNQAALLAGIIPAPSAWDPAVNPERAEQRFNRVISRMEDQGYLSAEQAANATMPETKSSTQGNNNMAGTKGYIIAAVRNELVESGKFTEQEVTAGRLEIHTSIDPKLQQYAVETVDALPADRPENNYIGMLSVDPHNGEIKMMYGGADYLKRQRNTIMQDHAQAGSTFKAFALLAAMKQDISLLSRWNGNTPLQIGETTIQNYDNISRGRVTLLTATQHSINTAFVDLNQAVGPENTMEAAIEAGIPRKTPGLDDSLTNVLGSASPRGVDMAQAYGVFATGGVRVPYHMVVSVSRDGKEVYRASTEGKQVVDKQEALRVNYALQRVNTYGGTGETVARTLGRPSAGKTGTSSGPWSAWYIGYVPQMLTVVNMFQIGPNGEEQVLDGFGRYPYAIGGNTYPVDMWAEYMQKATQGMEVLDFEKPEAMSGVPGADNYVAPTPQGEAPALPSPMPTIPVPEDPTKQSAEAPQAPAAPEEQQDEPAGEPSREPQRAPADNQPPTNNQPPRNGGGEAGNGGGNRGGQPGQGEGNSNNPGGQGAGNGGANPGEGRGRVER